MDKFVLAQNPLRATNTNWIVHMLSPVVIIEVLEPGSKPPRTPNICQVFELESEKGKGEKWTLNVYYIERRTDGNLVEEEVKARQVLSRAWYWYKAYLENCGTSSMLDWLLNNRDSINISEIARQSGAPLQSLKYFVGGQRPLAEQWREPVAKVISELIGR